MRVAVGEVRMHGHELRSPGETTDAEAIEFNLLHTCNNGPADRCTRHHVVTASNCEDGFGGTDTLTDAAVNAPQF